MPRKRSRRFVIDADVARAAGEPASKDPRSQRCRGFLEAVRTISHRLALSRSLRLEWGKHASVFTRTWLIKMTNLRKVDLVEAAELRHVREAIEEFAADPGICRVMLKDVHLIEAALEADRIVVSMDHTVRGHFASAAPAIVELDGVIWVNPANPVEKPTEWLEAGAPLVRSRQLGYRPR